MTVTVRRIHWARRAGVGTIASAALALAFGVASPLSAHASVVVVADGGSSLVVNIGTDPAPFNGADCNGTNICTLRDAVGFANSQSGGAITFAAGVSQVSLNPTSQGVLLINPVTTPGAISITGNAVTPTIIDGGSTGTTGCLYTENVTVTLTHLQIQNCYSGSGGALKLYRASAATVTDDIFLDNKAVPEEGGNNGGAIDVFEGAAATVVTISNDTFTGNTAADEGGAIKNTSGTVNISNSTFTDNSEAKANGNNHGGGAVANSDPMTIKDSTFSGNSGYGGAVWQEYYAYDGGPPSLDVVNSTFFDNTSVGFYGGSAIQDDAGILDPFSVANDTFEGNAADTNHGAVEALGGAPGDTIVNSLLVANTPANCGGAEFTSTGNNLFSDSSCTLAIAGDLNDNTTANLQTALTDNGGPTETLALLPGSGAINAGSATTCSGAAAGVDQRGVTRPQGSACDIGAFEDDQPTLTVTNETAAPNSNDILTIDVAVVPNSVDAGTPLGTVTLDWASVTPAVVRPAFVPLVSKGYTGSVVVFTIGPVPAGAYTLTASYAPSNGFLPATGTGASTIALAAVSTPDTGAVTWISGSSDELGMAMILLGGILAAAAIVPRRRFMV